MPVHHKNYLISNYWLQTLRNSTNVIILYEQLKINTEQLRWFIHDLFLSSCTLYQIKLSEP